MQSYSAGSAGQSYSGGSTVRSYSAGGAGQSRSGGSRPRGVGAAAASSAACSVSGVGTDPEDVVEETGHLDSLDPPVRRVHAAGRRSVHIGSSGARGPLLLEAERGGRPAPVACRRGVNLDFRHPSTGFHYLFHHPATGFHCQNGWG